MSRYHADNESASLSSLKNATRIISKVRVNRRNEKLKDSNVLLHISYADTILFAVLCLCVVTPGDLHHGGKGVRRRDEWVLCFEMITHDAAEKNVDNKLYDIVTIIISLTLFTVYKKEQCIERFSSF